MRLYDIAFWIFITSGIAWLVWELIPEGWKKFWKYHREVEKDRRRNRRRKYTWSWRVGKFDKEV